MEQKQITVKIPYRSFLIIFTSRLALVRIQLCVFYRLHCCLDINKRFKFNFKRKRPIERQVNGTGSRSVSNKPSIIRVSTIVS